MAVIKAIHVLCAVLSGMGFFARGLLMAAESPMLRVRWIKISPHIIDTVLLISAIILASQWGWAALQQPWLAAKIIALLLYISLGMLALRFAKSKSVRVMAWASALLVFAYIVSVALSKSPVPLWK
jgi:uncharacterized membrane protein SirB2